MIQTVFRKFFVGAAGAVLLSAGAVSAQVPQVEARIAGLEHNEEYMALLREDALLQQREDSIVYAVDRIRRQLREEPAQREVYSRDILSLENRIFEIRNAKGRLIDRINTIEQEWVLANLNGVPRPAKSVWDDLVAEVPDSLKVRNLVDNLYFREHLGAEDLAALRRAQSLEWQAQDYAERFFSNYGTLADLVDVYAAAQTEVEAMAIYGRYEVLQRLNRILSDSLAATWNGIFDNKSYAYGYLLDKMGRDDILAREEQALSAAARQATMLQGDVASDAVADYFLRKQVMTDYEISVAEVLGLNAARDSLRGVANRLSRIDYRRPKIEIRERYFLDYDSLTFSSTPKYSAQHPIPECKVYANGTIYRILLGEFSSKRAATTFRGAQPLSYLFDEEGKWCYYAGGFATLDDAEAAQKSLKNRGFVRPEIVVWSDGVARNLSREPAAVRRMYRVEISGADVLSDGVRQAIASAGDEYELSRIGAQHFIVGAFDDRVVADRLAEAIRSADGGLQIRVAEIAEH